LELTTVGQVVVLLLLLFGSAFFTASEVGFLTISRSRVEQWRQTGGWSARVISYFHGHRAILLSTLILGITTCNYMAERIATGVFSTWLGAAVGPLVAFLIMTFIILTFCEATPMHWAACNEERAVRIMVAPVFIIAVIMAPAVFIISNTARGFLRLLGVRAGSVLPSVSEDQLKEMIEAGEEQGELEASEKRMLRGVLDFGDQKVSEVMTPRRDMVCVEQNESLQTALSTGIESRHTRLPVYDETPDNIVGMLSLKDLLPYLVAGEMDKPCKLVARPAYHVMEKLSADVALKQLQGARQMIAVVHDEYGGTAGVVTVEDLLEEIVGDILDEYDQEEPEVVQVGVGEYVCDAGVSLRILANYISRPLPVTEFDSLGGWLLDLAGHIPDAGETFEADDLRITVEQVTETRIEKTRVLDMHAQRQRHN
jgi:putative hemolysin